MPLLQRPVVKTKAAKMETSIRLMAEQRPPSAADICCTARPTPALHRPH